MVRTRIFYHKSKQVIDDWVRALKLQTTGVTYLSFDEKYERGEEIGHGKFSTVFECKNKHTQESIAAKQIVKNTLTDVEKEFLRDEIQIIRLISHPNVVEMKEVFENEKNIYIVMEQIKGGELFDHIK
jgi:calcium/calmodulin-dependent protein kinase I